MSFLESAGTEYARTSGKSANPASNLSKKRIPAGGVAAYYTYDKADRLSSLRYLKSGSGVAYFDYSRDAAARITKIRREGNLGVYYAYDELDRLRYETWLHSGTQIYAFSYDYDLSHNRTRMRREFAAGVEWDSSYYVYDVSDALTKRLVRPSNVTTYYHYDPNGALIKEYDGNATYYEYGANQLVTKVTPPIADGNPWSFTYDAQLNRSKINKGGSVSYYLWDGLNALEERDSSGSLITRYSYGTSPIYGIGSCVEIYQPSSGHKYLLVMDHRGTAYILLDETGAEVGRRWYDAFGVIVGASGSWPVDMGYQTNWFSFKIGAKDVCLSKYRIFVPPLGIFLGRDFLPSINKFCGWSNNPVGEVDSQGLENDNSRPQRSVSGTPDASGNQLPKDGFKFVYNMRGFDRRKHYRQYITSFIVFTTVSGVIVLSIETNIVDIVSNYVPPLLNLAIDIAQDKPISFQDIHAVNVQAAATAGNVIAKYGCRFSVTWQGTWYELPTLGESQTRSDTWKKSAVSSDPTPAQWQFTRNDQIFQPILGQATPDLPGNMDSPPITATPLIKTKHTCIGRVLANNVIVIDVPAVANDYEPANGI